MDRQTQILIIVASLLAFAILFFAIETSIANKQVEEIDTRIDDIYRDIGRDRVRYLREFDEINNIN